jgi:hypothetical protein
LGEHKKVNFYEISRQINIKLGSRKSKSGLKLTELSLPRNKQKKKLELNLHNQSQQKSRIRTLTVRE